MSTEIVSTDEDVRPLIRRKRLGARNLGSMRTEIFAGEHSAIQTDEPEAHGGTGAGPSPLQLVVGALCGCESVTFHRTAKEMDFCYASIDFEAEFSIDIRGRMGVRSVRQYFQTVRVEAIVISDDSSERLREVVEETEARCPVYNLLNDAGVNLQVRWILKRSDASADGDG